MISNSILSKSEHFNSLTHIQKEMVSKKINREKITLGLKMSELRGFDYWVSKCNPTERIKNIVSDLIIENKDS